MRYVCRVLIHSFIHFIHALLLVVYNTRSPRGFYFPYNNNNERTSLLTTTNQKKRQSPKPAVVSSLNSWLPTTRAPPPRSEWTASQPREHRIPFQGRLLMSTKTTMRAGAGRMQVILPRKARGRLPNGIGSESGIARGGVRGDSVESASGIGDEGGVVRRESLIVRLFDALLVWVLLLLLLLSMG